jgi:SAM-dependent methyltransferase
MRAKYKGAESIGPRSEIEIFGLHAAGFQRHRISAIDLLSYSPYVRVGDVHAMPYGDDSFEAVLLGRVFAYSRSPEIAAKEVVRVSRHGAIVVVTAGYNDGSRGSAFNNEENRNTSVNQILEYFAPISGTIYFRHEADFPKTMIVTAMFEIEFASDRVYSPPRIPLRQFTLFLRVA